MNTFQKLMEASLLLNVSEYKKKEEQYALQISILKKLSENTSLIWKRRLLETKKTFHNYDWMMIEMNEQAVRHRKGGNMLDYLLQDTIPNKEYITPRIGRVVKAIWSKENATNKNSLLSIIKRKPISKLFSIGWGMLNDNLRSEYFILGRYRLDEEIHQWMYDRYSLKKLLEEAGFTNVVVYSPKVSGIPECRSFNLNTNEIGEVNKPYSFFIEGKKL